MLPGPCIIRKCAVCRKLCQQDTIESGNTCGARYWTDGMRFAPMLPDNPRLVKCPHCASLVWINEQESVGEAWPVELENTPFEGALPYHLPSVHDYCTFLRTGQVDRDNERYLRIRAWWTGNDARRYDQPFTPFSDEELDNLHALAGLLNQSDDNDRVMKAEIMRELGRYEDATALLSVQLPESLASAAATIRNLAAQKISRVKEMIFDD